MNRKTTNTKNNHTEPNNKSKTRPEQCTAHTRHTHGNKRNIIDTLTRNKEPYTHHTLETQQRQPKPDQRTTTKHERRLHRTEHNVYLLERNIKNHNPEPYSQRKKRNADDTTQTKNNQQPHIITTPQESRTNDTRNVHNAHTDTL